MKGYIVSVLLIIYSWYDFGIHLAQILDHEPIIMSDNICYKPNLFGKHDQFEVVVCNCWLNICYPLFIYNILNIIFLILLLILLVI